MNNNNANAADRHLSKSLSWLLRHGAVKEQLHISSDGFIKVDEILSHRTFRHKYTEEDIKRIVVTNDKQRFTLKRSVSNALLIKANQGHSLQCVHGLELHPITQSCETIEAIHGTYLKHWPSIKANGLSRMQRNHIHLAPAYKAISGIRRDCNLFIHINVRDALKDGIEFYRSPNEVILSPGDQDGCIPSRYFLKVVTKSGEELA